jgi:hypothetical protein
MIFHFFYNNFCFIYCNIIIIGCRQGFGGTPCYRIKVSDIEGYNRWKLIKDPLSLRWIKAFVLLWIIWLNHLHSCNSLRHRKIAEYSTQKSLLNETRQPLNHCSFLCAVFASNINQQQLWMNSWSPSRWSLGLCNLWSSLFLSQVC